MNNLYGWAMNEYLPYCGFEWLENIDNFGIMSINDKSPIGYFLKVDLEYPKELHELHNDFPLAPEKPTVSNDMMSKYYKKIVYVFFFFFNFSNHINFSNHLTLSAILFSIFAFDFLLLTFDAR